MRRALSTALALATLGVLSGCETTQDKAERLRSRGSDAFEQRGLRVARQNPDVAVGATTVIKDRNGTAAVVEIRNRTGRTLAGLPIAIDVRGRGRRSVFRNDYPGLEPSLVSASVLPGRASLTWVNDQVQATDAARDVRAKVGKPRGRPPARLPRLEVSRPRYDSYESTGLFVRGNVTNRSKVEQRKLILFAVARRGGRVVAAGRGGIERLPGGARRLYRIFFIGNPRGASIEIDAPPTVLG